MTSASLVQVIDLTDSPPPINNGTRKFRKATDHDVEVTATRASRKRKNGETGRSRTLAESRDRSAEVENAKLEEVVETRRAEGAKGGNGESTKKRSRRSMKSKDKSKDPLENIQQDLPPTLDDSQFFFVDTAPAPVPTGMVFDSGGADGIQPSSSRAPEADKIPLLLLPAHVSVLDAVDDSELPIQIVQPADSDSDAESYIEYLDYDDRLTAGTVRYFETPMEDQKQARFVCKRCGAESDHRARECPVMICLTCGARDEHSTRSCPISKTCFTCGMKGHINKTCPNRHSRDKVSQYDDCDRCGSSTHNTNECPTIWRLYEYVTEREREAILRHRESKQSLALGEGGEGYIAPDEWCYNCGNSGHLGDDCNDSRPHDTPSVPSAFGKFNTFTGPFSDDTVGAPPVHARAPRDWETSDAPINVGKRARNKDRMRMEQRALEIEELADPDDWFGNPRNVRNRGMGGGGVRRDRDRDRDRGRERSGGMKDMKIRFLESARKRDDPPLQGPSLLERVHGGDDKRSRHYRHRDHSRDRGRSGEGNDRRWEGSRSGDREQERHRDGHRGRPGGHERERRTSWEGRGARGPQYRGGYAR
ncbi:hypothetical protein BJY52DRAFT_1201603 [Lactarius psammicola]|nr:hypothetical protein BJY52DRAFT_1201603 [Lactarius psammicola]